MKTKDFILLGAGYAAGRLSKKINAGPIGAVSGKYVVNYKQKGGNLPIGFYKIQAKNKTEAIKKAKNEWLKDWAITFNKADAERTIKKMFFYIQ